MYCIVMAGGSGTRFWPKSREEKAKQFLNIYGKNSLIASTLARFHAFIKWKNIYVVGKQSQKELLEKHCSKIPKENILYEPVGKNTAPCIGLAALAIQKKDPEAIVVVSPADHLIQKQSRFQRVIETGVHLADKREGLVTIGICPDRPSTGYGYIQVDKKVESAGQADAYQIKTFAEKPNLATAKRFIECGDFYWNSGIFIFKVSVFLKQVRKLIPDLYKQLMEIKRHMQKPEYENKLKRVYQKIKNISIDYGIMEKAANVYMVRGDFTWNDLGSWEQVYKLGIGDKDGNVVQGKAVLLDTKNSYISSSKGLIAVLGLEDVVVVQDGSATLVCKRDKAEEVKNIVEKLKKNNLKKYL
jgi:mannose-1-phosphate guanylyltransferase